MNDQQAKVSNQKDLFPELNAVFKQNSSEFSDEFLKALKHNEILKNAKIKIDEDELKKIFRSYKKQSEIDFFIHKLKAVWLKPKFAKKVEYVFSLDRLNPLLDSIINDKGFESQIKEWQELGFIDEGLNKEELLHSLFKHKETQRDVSALPQHDKTLCHFEQCEKSHVSLQKSETSNKNMDCHDSLRESRNDKEANPSLRKSETIEAIHNIESKTNSHDFDKSNSRNDVLNAHNSTNAQYNESYKGKDYAKAKALLNYNKSRKLIERLNKGESVCLDMHTEYRKDFDIFHTMANLMGLNIKRLFLDFRGIETCEFESGEIIGCDSLDLAKYPKLKNLIWWE